VKHLKEFQDFVIYPILNEEVIQGDKTDPYEYKKDGDIYYTRKKGSNQWIKTSGKTSDAIKTKIFSKDKKDSFISPAYKLTPSNFDSTRYQRDTFDPYAQQAIKQRQMGEMKAQDFAKGIVPVKKESGIKPHYRIFSDFLRLRKNPVTTADFTPDELKTMMEIIKKAKPGAEPKNVNFPALADIHFSKVVKGTEAQTGIDQKKAIAYVLGNAQVADKGNYYRVTDVYDFNNYQNHPENYTLDKLPGTVSAAFKKLFSGNLVQGVEELASYYQKLGYKGIPVSIDIPKNLV
jgi:hypothetical protein